MSPADHGHDQLNRGCASAALLSIAASTSEQNSVVIYTDLGHDILQRFGFLAMLLEYFRILCIETPSAIPILEQV